MAAFDTNMREGIINDFKVGATKKIEKGNHVFAKEATGFAFTPTVADPAAAGDRYLGIAVETIDNTLGTDGLVDVRAYAHGVHQIPATGFTQPSVGDRVKLAANGGSHVAAAGTYYVGVVVAVSATAIDLQIDTAFGSIYA